MTTALNSKEGKELLVKAMADAIRVNLNYSFAGKSINIIAETERASLENYHYGWNFDEENH